MAWLLVKVWGFCKLFQSPLISPPRLLRHGSTNLPADAFINEISCQIIFNTLDRRVQPSEEGGVTTQHCCLLFVCPQCLWIYCIQNLGGGGHHTPITNKTIPHLTVSTLLLILQQPEVVLLLLPLLLCALLSQSRHIDHLLVCCCSLRWINKKIPHLFRWKIVSSSLLLLSSSWIVSRVVGSDPAVPWQW